MKMFVCGMMICVMLAGSVMGCSQSIDSKIPVRGIWDGQTYTNSEMGIRLTVPERYHIDTDAELIKWLCLNDDYYNDLQNKQRYYDIYIEDNTSGSYSKMIIEYLVDPSANPTAKQKLKQYKTQNTRYNLYNNMDTWFDIVYGDDVEFMLCGETYLCCNFTLENMGTFYRLLCYRVTPGKVTVFIEITGNSDEEVKAYLTFFDTAGVS